MKRAAIFTAVLLLGSAFAFTGAANAEDIDECRGESTPAVPTEVCVEDSTEGDQDEACDSEGSGSYEGRTAIEARAGDEAPAVDAEAGGDETCEHRCTFRCTFEENERVFVDASVCVQGERFCETEAEAALAWGQDGVDASGLEGASVESDAGSVWVNALWTERHSGNATDVRAGFCATEQCEPVGGADADWGEDEIEVSADVCLERSFFRCDQGALVEAWWGEDFRGNCHTGAFAYATGAGMHDAEEGCPAGAPPGAQDAPGSPNPGWGEVTPDVPDMLEEQLPE